MINHEMSVATRASAFSDLLARCIATDGERAVLDLEAAVSAVDVYKRQT